MVDRWPKLVQFTGRVYRSSLRLICYMFEFHVNFSGLIFGSSLRSNLRVFCGNVYGTILRLTLLDRFTERFYGLNSRAEFKV